MEGNKSNQEMQGLCKEGCGFYGSSANEGFCSQCFKKRLRRWLHLNEPSTPTPPTTAATTPMALTTPITDPVLATTPIIAPAPTTSILKVQDITTILPTTATTALPTTSVTPATTATPPTTRAIISSSVDRVECGGDDSEDELVICSSSTDEKDRHKNVEKQREEVNLHIVGGDNNTEKKSSEANTPIDYNGANNSENDKSEDLKNSSLIDNKDSFSEGPSTPKEERGEVEGDVSVVLTTVLEDLEGEKGTRKKNRCFMCNKKVGLTGFGCRCGDVFCSQHRYSDTHHCPFDYKGLGKQEIEKNNPKVAFEKVAKI